MVSFTSQPPNCWEMNQWLPLDAMLSGPQNQSDLWDDGKNHLSLSGMKLCSPVIPLYHIPVLAELSQFHCCFVR